LSYFGFKAEEAPSALLLAQAALLSAKKQARRRAALWYASAAGRLEKCGIVNLFILPSSIINRRTLMVISLETSDHVFLAQSAGIIQHTFTQGIIAFVLGFRRKVGYGYRRAGRYPIRY
jgi:hypothetical protein